MHITRSHTSPSAKALAQVFQREYATSKTMEKHIIKLEVKREEKNKNLRIRQTFANGELGDKKFNATYSMNFSELYIEINDNVFIVKIEDLIKNVLELSIKNK